MLLLAMNPLRNEKMRRKVNLFLSILPDAGMLSPLLLIFIFRSFLLKMVGANSYGVVPLDSRGIIIVIVFLLSVLSMMFVGYILGWYLNTIVMRVMLKWSKEKVKSVFLFSEIPPEWKAGSNERNPDSVLSLRNSSWQETRKGGKWSFVFKCGVCGYGLLMFVLMNCLDIFLYREPISFSKFLFRILLWSILGFISGLIMWHFSEYCYCKQKQSRS